MTPDPAHAPGAPLHPGMRIAGRYELIERLGGGGVGEVFRALDVYDMLESPDEGRYLILELVPGRSFADELRERGRLRWALRRRRDAGLRGTVGRPRRLGRAPRHQAGEHPHRRGRGVVVADFGIARLETASAATAEGAMIGTPD